MKTYIHKTDHRLRIRSDFIKRNPGAVEHLITDLHKMDAIQEIKHKRHAGSVAITFDQTGLDCAGLLTMLESNSWTKRENKNFYIENIAINGGKTLAKGVATVLLSRVVGPSVGRLIFS